MSRKKAKTVLSMNEYRATMAGIYTTSISKDTLDEAPMAYKKLNDIIDVIRESVDVIDIMRPMPKEDWVTVDVITMAAPDLRTGFNIRASMMDDGTYMNDAELFGYHVKRAIHMLTVAAAKGADVLVLGAFGCGAFENNPDVVARAYDVAIKQFPKVFKRIEFAIYCPPGVDANYEAFKGVFF